MAEHSSSETHSRSRSVAQQFTIVDFFNKKETRTVIRNKTDGQGEVKEKKTSEEVSNQAKLEDILHDTLEHKIGFKDFIFRSYVLSELDRNFLNLLINLWKEEWHKQLKDTGYYPNHKFNPKNDRDGKKFAKIVKKLKRSVNPMPRWKRVGMTALMVCTAILGAGMIYYTAETGFNKALSWLLETISGKPMTLPWGFSFTIGLFALCLGAVLYGKWIFDTFAGSLNENRSRLRNWCQGLLDTKFTAELAARADALQEDYDDSSMDSDAGLAATDKSPKPPARLLKEGASRDFVIIRLEKRLIALEQKNQILTDEVAALRRKDTPG